MNTSMTASSSNRQHSSGQSLRQQAFFLFDLGERPAVVSRILGMKFRTASRYYQKWKNLPRVFEGKYQHAQQCYKRLGKRERGVIAGILAGELGIPKKAVLARMQQPWGLKQIIDGRWRLWGEQENSATRVARIPHQLNNLSLLEAPWEVKHILELALHPKYGPVDEEIRGE